MDVTTAVPVVGNPNYYQNPPNETVPTTDWFYGWMYVKDAQASTGTLVNGEDYAKVMTNDLVHTDDIDFATRKAPVWWGESPDYVYLEANMTDAFYGESYAAVIKVEAFTE